MRARLALTLTLAMTLASCGTNSESETRGTPSGLQSVSTATEVETSAVGQDLPRSVARTRGALEVATAAKDYGTLESFIPAEGFTYTYGDRFPGGPTAYWKKLAREHDPGPLDVLSSILAMPYTKVGEKYVWPFAYDRDPSSLTHEELDLLARVASPEEIRQWKESGHYLGWRTGIRSDGTWIFFVAGD